MKRVVMAHPSPDLYGSDRMLLQSVRALVDEAEVLVTLPCEGPLADRLRAEGADVEVLDVPVLRKAYFSPWGLARLTVLLATRLPAMVAFLRRRRPDVLYVNTLTIPWWLLAGRLSRVGRVACHVHEAEAQLPGPIRRALCLPTRLAHITIANSASCRSRVVADGAPPATTITIHNGVAVPAMGPPREHPEGALVLIGRLSPRKGSDVAVRATAILSSRGRDVVLRVVGDVFPGYEWFDRQLRELAGPNVIFAGFTDPVWEHLADADVVLMPSHGESFGLVAVEGMMAGRPVVASDVQGLNEIITHGETGLLVPADDPVALADAIESLLDDWPRAQAVAAKGQADALARFAVPHYQDRLRSAIFDILPHG
ncbi:glycosyltransferase family 4 protein [Nonomuraea mangrovi]|uniref:Glycosyltransferase family 4 protein n=1 Tax=Nonomuraea mangrovi TaxID=2316207 RepID=A0ABW4T4Q7_9ACTN